MDDSFCLWAPWVFSALAGTAGWLLRWWYDDHKMDQLHGIIKTKEEDLYHLNEAHNLLLEDKRTKIAAFESDVESKNRVISELKQSLSQAETTNKSLLGQIVDAKRSRKKTTSAPLAAAAMPSATVSQKTLSQPDEDKAEVVTTPSVDLAKRKRRRRRRRCKKKLTKANGLIKRLKSENKRLLNEVSQAEQVTEVVKEIPVTILKTIRIKEKVDRQKLKKLIKDLPLIKSKKTVSKKKKKGKVRIVS